MLGLCWCNKEKKEFWVLWKYVGKFDFVVEKDVMLFKFWVEYIGKYCFGEFVDFLMWKIRFWCVLYKMLDVEEVKVFYSLDEKEFYWVFCFKDKGKEKEWCELSLGKM